MNHDNIMKRLNDLKNDEVFDKKEFANIAADVDKALSKIYGNELIEESHKAPGVSGLNAFFDGKKESDNPYEKDTDNYDDWLDGYKEARRIKETKNK